MKANGIVKKTMKGVCILMGTAVLIAFIVNSLSSKGIPLIGKWNPKEGVVHADASNGVVHPELEIGDVKTAKQIYDRGKSIFVDARSEDDFKDGHVKGAVSLPIYRFEELIGGFKEKYTADDHIVTYCSGRTCEDSHQLAQLLFSYGYVNVSVFIDGYPAWEKEEYPIE